MSGGTHAHCRFSPRCLPALAAAVLLASPVYPAWGQVLRNAVGGVSVDVGGVLGEPTNAERRAVLDELRKGWREAPDDLNGLVELRKISLRGLEAAIEAARKGKLDTLPDEVKYLSGLQRIRYVFLYPEDNDIVLAGPAEGWKIDNTGVVVGVTTGRPVLLLEDLLVALRSANQARAGGISCSIDPTEEGYRKLNAFLDRQRRSRTTFSPQLEAAIKQAFGPQQIKLTGVPADTHFARVLVSADYRMKRLGMNLEKAPVPGLPSYVDLIKNSRSSSLSTNPRWWLACDYQPLAKSDDGLAWELRGPGVKAMTEDDFVSADGQVRGTGRKNAMAQKWADLMNQRYNDLSVKLAVFGQLRNLMDMCVVAAAIEKYDLMGKAGCSLPLLTGAAGDLSAPSWNAPKTVAPQCSFMQTRNGLLITASGGVQIDSWTAAARTEQSGEIKRVRSQIGPRPSQTWRWN